MHSTQQSEHGMERLVGQKQPLFRREDMGQMPGEMIVDVNNLIYPVLRINQGMIFLAMDAARITTCSKIALSNGFFKNQNILDSSGNMFLVNEAKKLHGLGPFCGYNIFLNQRIQVQLDLSFESKLSLSQIKYLVLKALKNNQGWDSLDGIEDITKTVEEAPSIGKIINFIFDVYENR